MPYKAIDAAAGLLLAAALLAACGNPAVGEARGSARPTPAVTASPTAALPSPAASPVQESGGVIKADPTPTPAPDPTAEPTKRPTPPDMSPYYIYVEKGSNTVTVYGLDENDEYTVVVQQYLAALGKTAGRTPTGTFKLTKKRERWHRFSSSSETVDSVYAPYATQYHGGLLIHGPIYTSKRNTAMTWRTYGEFGKNTTAGCIRICAGGAYWIMTNCPPGTTVEIVNGSPRGTQATQPPAPSEEYPQYDPSDPAPPGEEPENLAIPTPVPTKAASEEGE